MATKNNIVESIKIADRTNIAFSECCRFAAACTEVPVVVTTDVEPDDLLALLYLFKKKIPIRAILVLSDRFKRDNWDRYKHLLEFIATLRLTIDIGEFDCEECLDIDNAAPMLESLMKKHRDCKTIISLANIFPLMVMQQTTLSRAQKSTTNGVNDESDHIDIWMYGSAYFRWAAEHLRNTPGRGNCVVDAEGNSIKDDYDTLSDKINCHFDEEGYTNRLHFHIFETFGAFKKNTSSRISGEHCHKLYQWIAEDSSQISKLLRRKAHDWNNVIFKDITKFIGADVILDFIKSADKSVPITGDTELTFELLQQNIELIASDINDMVDKNPKLRVKAKVLLEMCRFPYEIVCADIGLGVTYCDERLRLNFLPCKVDFGGRKHDQRRYTNPSFISKNSTAAESSSPPLSNHPTYFVEDIDSTDVDMFTIVTDAAYQTFSSVV